MFRKKNFLTFPPLQRNRKMLFRVQRTIEHFHSPFARIIEQSYLDRQNKGEKRKKNKKKRKFVRPWQKSTLQLRLKNLVASSLESVKQRFPRKSLETFKTVTILHQIQHYIVNETLDGAHSKRTASAPILPIQITRHCWKAIGYSIRFVHGSINSALYFWLSIWRFTRDRNSDGTPFVNFPVILRLCLIGQFEMRWSISRISFSTRCFLKFRKIFVFTTKLRFYCFFFLFSHKSCIFINQFISTDFIVIEIDRNRY